MKDATLTAIAELLTVVDDRNTAAQAKMQASLDKANRTIERQAAAIKTAHDNLSALRRKLLALKPIPGPLRGVVMGGMRSIESTLVHEEGTPELTRTVMVEVLQSWQDDITYSMLAIESLINSIDIGETNNGN